MNLMKYKSSRKNYTHRTLQGIVWFRKPVLEVG